MAANVQRDVGFSRLQEEQKRALEDCKGRLVQWEHFGADYDALHRKLTDLPNKVSHDVMVPFGCLAFMPGQLYHTNEIHVLLGDNWFALRSAHQATEIVERRKKFVSEKVTECKKELQYLEEQVKYTEDFQSYAKEESKFVEIKEDIGEEEQVKGERKRVAHAQKWTKKPTLSEAEKTPASQDDIWARLDELERQEEERGELESESSSTKKSESVAKIEQITDSKITFHHTPSDLQDASQTTVPSESGDMMSPADLFLKYSSQTVHKDSEAGKDSGLSEGRGADGTVGEKKGVKWSQHLEDVHPIPNRKEEKRMDRKEPRVISTPLGEEEAFSGVIRERSVDQSHMTPTWDAQENETAHKVSKFKASRKKR